MSGADKTAAAGWKRHWPMVLAAMASFSFNGGVRHFGVVLSLMGLAGGIGQLAGGFIFAFTGRYTALMVAGIPLAPIAGLAVYGLGPYPVYAPEAEK